LDGFFAAAGLPLSGTELQGSSEPAPGTLEISFLFHKAEGVVPSYQIAVWLEDEAGKLVKTLFVSEYLALAGTSLETVCPDWVRQSNWDKVEDAEFDAVTRPTPPVDSNSLKFDCNQRKIVPGTYRFCVQAHIAEDYNILYRGKIEVGEDRSEGSAEVFYSPKRHAKAGDILYDVRARYLSEPGSGNTKEGEKP
jgi:hypothetical protein